MTADLFELCYCMKWTEVRKYLPSDAAEEEKKSNTMCRSDDGAYLHLACCHDAPNDVVKAMIDIGPRVTAA